MPAPATVRELVERFRSHADAYRSGQYNEAQLREEFLNPFFAALGWDVYNKKGYAEAYKEVDRELLLAFLNSRLLRAFWIEPFYDQRRTFPKIKGTYLKHLPLPPIDWEDESDATQPRQLAEAEHDLPSGRSPVLRSTPYPWRRRHSEQTPVTNMRWPITWKSYCRATLSRSRRSSSLWNSISRLQTWQ